jgi:hypothetical protein
LIIHSAPPVTGLNNTLEGGKDLAALYLVMPVVEQMHERTGKDQEIGKYPQKMRSMFRKKKRCGDSEKTNQYPSITTVLSFDFMGHRGVIHC